MNLRTTLLAGIAAITLALPAIAQEIIVDDPYARSANPRSGAVFMLLENVGDADDRLIAARTDAANRVELHTHIDKGDGVMQMTEIEGGIPIAAGETHFLQRGGDHVMLMGLTAPLEQGDTITLTLVFEKSGELTFEVPVDITRKPGAGARGGQSN